MQDMKRYGHLAIVAMVGGIFSHVPLSTQGSQLMYRKYKHYQSRAGVVFFTRTLLEVKWERNGIAAGSLHGYGPSFSCSRSRLFNSFTRRQTPDSTGRVTDASGAAIAGAHD